MALVFAAVATLVLTGCAGQPSDAAGAMPAPSRSAQPVVSSTQPPSSSAQPPSSSVGEPAPGAPLRQAAELTAEDVADPVRVRVPAVGIDAAIGPLFVDENGVLPPPETFEMTGWWHGGPEPGEVGPAVIAGHVDSHRGPAVFYHLDKIRHGDRIFVDRADGSTVTFLVQRTERHPKDKFPTKAVYGDTAGSTLRLITCGGEFDDDDRRYLDNIIVYATASTG